VQNNPEFFKKFYNFKISVDNFLDIKVIKNAFILALIKHFPKMIKA